MKKEMIQFTTEQLARKAEIETELDAKLIGHIQENQRLAMLIAEYRDAKYYLLEFATWEECVKTKWSISRSHSYRLIDFGKAVKNNAQKPMNSKKACLPAGDIQTNERHQLNGRHRLKNERQFRKVKESKTIRVDPRQSALKNVKNLHKIQEVKVPIKSHNNFVAAERPANFDCYSSAPARKSEPFEPDDPKDSKWEESVLALVVLRQDAWADELSEQPEKITGEIIAAVRKAL